MHDSLLYFLLYLSCILTNPLDYFIYPLNSDTLTPYHTYPKIWTNPITNPIYIFLKKWQTK